MLIFLKCRFGSCFYLSTSVGGTGGRMFSVWVVACWFPFYPGFSVFPGSENFFIFLQVL